MITSIWMIRTGEDFESPLILLRETRNVKFGDFLAPGETLEITAEKIKESDSTITVKASGQKDGRTTVSARLILERCGSGDRLQVGTEEEIRDRVRDQFSQLFGDIAVSNNV